MKKIGLALAIALLAIGTVSAQGWGNWGGASQTTVTVEGTLQLQNGQIAVSSGNATFFVPMLGRYVGFVEGLREGARVSVVGYASGNFLQPVQFTIDGRTYDLLPAGPAYGGFGHCWDGFGGPMRGRGGFGRGRW